MGKGRSKVKGLVEDTEVGEDRNDFAGNLEYHINVNALPLAQVVDSQCQWKGYQETEALQGNTRPDVLRIRYDGGHNLSDI